MEYNNKILNLISKLELDSIDRNLNLDNFNIPDFLKSGGKIHIKKKNRGKFTDYCGGKVTEECIRKGKNSSDPKVRKMATFAANSRKWNK